MDAPSTQDFQFVGGNLAVDLVNTVGNRLWESRDYLSDTAELARWLRLAGLDGSSAAEGGPGALGRVRRVRETLYRLMAPFARGRLPVAEDLEPLNRLLRPVMARRRVVPQGTQVAWGLDAEPDGVQSALDAILLDAADLLVSGRFRRLRECEGPRCGWLFVDQSRSGRRRWCSMADCGNRAKVSRHYHRHAGGPATPPATKT